MKPARASNPPQSAPPNILVSPRNAEDLGGQMQQIQHAIANRAYELFEARHGEHGHDWEDWFRAESELLRPVPVSMSESDDRISVRANVFGFDEKELAVSIAPPAITILGKKGTRVAKSEGGKIEDTGGEPSHILRFIDLAAEVVPESAVVELQAGLLKFEFHKTTARTASTEVTAA